MSGYSDYGMQTLECEGEELFYQLASEDEESSDEEYFDSIENLEDCEQSLISLKKSDEKVSASVSSELISDVQPQSSAAAENVNVDELCDVQQYSSKDVHSSSEESKSAESSTDRAYVIKLREGHKGSSEYVDLDMVDAIVDDDVAKLMQKCRVDHYSARNSKVDLMHAKCRLLFERDYLCEAVDNSGGSLCNHYPVRLIIPVAKKSNSACSNRVDGVEFDKDIYTEEVRKSTTCRLRKRFVAPVIMFDKKFICRAGTITVRKTAIFETARKSSSPQAQNVNDSPIKRKARNIARTVIDVSSRGCQAATQLFVPNSIRKLRNTDAQIIRDLKIQYICDLMIEDRKMYKRVRLSSSEKINPDIYCDCNIEQMPYPGCRFFKRYHEANHIPEGLVFNWNRPDANTVLKLTEDPFRSFPDVEWDDYKEWDVLELTKNYMKILLSYLAKGRGGLLVHCVSGWDRTPLFISILRVSLWADGIIHESLDYRDMAYLTLAYDWYLFGHDLPSRLRKKEEIMHFCFKFLPYIASDEFSLTRIFHELPSEQKENGSFPDFKPESRIIINDLSSYVMKVYDEFISGAI